MTAIPTDLIDIRTDARAIDETAVAGLAESIASVGLINPIRVRANGDRWELIAGGHRLAAHKQLGLAEIECAVVTDDDLHAELAMIDENLIRRELSQAERSACMSRRRDIYNVLYNPFIGRGGHHQVPEGQLADPTFASATADAIGVDKRTVYKILERGDKVISEVLDMIKGSKLDTTTFLDSIKDYPPNDQFKVAERELARIRADDRDKKRRALARHQKPAVDVEDVTEKQFESLMSAWNKAGEDARQRFLVAIDTPVMDRNAA